MGAVSVGKRGQLGGIADRDGRSGILAVLVCFDDRGTGRNRSKFQIGVVFRPDGSLGIALVRNSDSSDCSGRLGASNMGHGRSGAGQTAGRNNINRSLANESRDPQTGKLRSGVLANAFTGTQIRSRQDVVERHRRHHDFLCLLWFRTCHPRRRASRADLCGAISPAVHFRTIYATQQLCHIRGLGHACRAGQSIRCWTRKHCDAKRPASAVSHDVSFRLWPWNTTPSRCDPVLHRHHRVRLAGRIRRDVRGNSGYGCGRNDPRPALRASALDDGRRRRRAYCNISNNRS